ncbi:HD-GYP domain-containing protein [Paenibacillus sp. GCM10027626]|uniref:HD-GYP domain-containing protein n=1 Tax=Paenibacillus sp. GCM10027626 TaxID=3273411 RepID=UPI00363EE4EA
MLMTDKSKLLVSYYQKHREQVNNSLLKLAAVYLLLSICWNAFFSLFQLPYSRANLPLLIICIVIWGGLEWGRRQFKLSATVVEHLVILFICFVVCCLYFGSGYREAWGYLLLIPIAAAFYGDRPVLITYSTLGLLLMIILGTSFPLVPGYDQIDLSNRLLLYAIIATFSYLVLQQLNKLYESQVNTILDSANASIEQVVKTFIVAVEAKDFYTFGHSERVSKYAVELARLLPEYNDQKRLKQLRLTGLLHDIGKINIPEQVLGKEGALTPQEYALVKTHPVVGSRMVEKIEMLESLKPGVLYHHEKWDGSGYPAGLKGENIPLEARILAIADVFDALTSNRAYRDAIPLDEAFAILEAGDGTHFDPNLMKLLPAIKGKWIEIYIATNDDVEELEIITDFL